MKRILEKVKQLPWKNILPLLWLVIPISLIGGLFTGMYTVEHTEGELLESLLSQFPDVKLFYFMTAIQSLVYAVLATVAGFLLANRIGLVKPLGFKKSILQKTVPVILVLGILFTCDYWVFGRLIPEVAADYEKGISIPYFISSLTYGGVIEEILLRWFVMSLIGWILVLLFARDKAADEIPVWIYMAANVLAAGLFAAGHLPATVMFFGGLTPLIVFRCFLMNGAFAIVFGRYYHKYGIQYAMLAHFGLHLVHKVILMIII